MSYVYLNDEGAAYSASGDCGQYASQLNGCEPPPHDEVTWGDDDFGHQMRQSYYKAQDDGRVLPFATPDERRKVADKFNQLSTGLDQVITALVYQDLQSALDLRKIDVP